MVRIHATWQSAARSAGIRYEIPEEPALPLTAFDALHTHQSGEVTFEAYLEALAGWLGANSEDARLAHAAIIAEEFPGIPELVRDVRRAGWRTGCLSNTNEPHWRLLIDPAHYPTVASLDPQMASHVVGLGKPDPAIYRLFAETAEVGAAQIVFFDDSAANVAAANEEGWRAFQIDPENDPPAQMRRILTDLGVLP